MPHLHLPEISLPALTLEETLLIGRAVFLIFCFVLAATAFTRWRRAADRAAEDFVTRSGVLAQRLAGMEERIASLSAKLAEKTESEPAVRAPGGATASSYQIAIRLARSGAAPEILVEDCGLSRQEAELVRRIHGAKSQRARLQAASK